MDRCVREGRFAGESPPEGSDGGADGQERGETGFEEATRGRKPRGSRKCGGLSVVLEKSSEKARFSEGERESEGESEGRESRRRWFVDLAMVTVSGMWRGATDKVREWPADKRRRFAVFMGTMVGLVAATAAVVVSMVSGREEEGEDAQKTGAEMLEPDGTYVVKTGDTLYSVAKRLDTSVRKLAEANECLPLRTQGLGQAQEDKRTVSFRSARERQQERQQEQYGRSAPAPNVEDVDEARRKGTCVRTPDEIFVGQVLKVPELE